MPGRLAGLGRTSPSGQPTCPSSGPLDAAIVLIGESPGRTEIAEQVPLVGQAGRLLGKGLAAAGIDRAKTRMINLVPALAPGNDFGRHTPQDYAWGVRRLQDELDALTPPAGGKRIIIGLGANPLKALKGFKRITTWRGSLFPPAADVAGFDARNRYWELRTGGEVSLGDDVAFMATFHPAAVLRQMPWHVWLIHDLTRAKRWVDGRDYRMVDRRWYVNEPAETRRLIYDVILGGENMVSIDTEMSGIVCLVTEQEVHSFHYGPEYHKPLVDLMASPRVMKVAHNMAHDWRQFEKWWGIPVAQPYYDTMCLAHIMEPSGQAAGDRDKSAGEQQVGKSLSPHLATRFTPWPYHKWMVDVDELIYCGLDGVVGYDAYWEELKQATPEQLELARFDSKLWPILFDMQRRGILVDQENRAYVIMGLEHDMEDAQAAFLQLAQPIVEERLSAFNKPHLFMQMKQCKCCGGGRAAQQHCWRCAGYEKKPTKAMMVERGGDATLKAADLYATLEPCRACGGEGKLEEWQEINVGSPSQVADILYRGFRIPPRRFQGEETTRIEQLERLLDHGSYLGEDQVLLNPGRAVARLALETYRKYVLAETERNTAERITPGEDGRTRCTFDLWYTPTSRVASREGLLDQGTNLQNIPKKARALLIPSPDHFFIYPDYRQVEGRSMAVITQDPALLGIYAKPDADSHQEVADMVTRAGTPITRDQAKRTFFSVCYGVEAPHLSSILGCSESEAGTIIKAILRTFPGVKRMREQVKQELRLKRGVTTITGWTRRWLGHIAETRGRNRGEIKKKVMKEALATKPQYMGARVLGQGLIQVNEAVPWILPAAHIHDASLVEVPIPRAAEAILALEQHMTVRAWGMLFPVDASCGPNWYVASMSDAEKQAKGYGAWTREALLANGAPG